MLVFRGRSRRIFGHRHVLIVRCAALHRGPLSLRLVQAHTRPARVRMALGWRLLGPAQNRVELRLVLLRRRTRLRHRRLQRVRHRIGLQPEQVAECSGSIYAALVRLGLWGGYGLGPMQEVEQKLA